VAELSERERACLERYLLLLRERLGARLLAVHMFGSAARGDMWPERSPLHSDIDLLIVTADEVSEAERDALVDETYPHYLECGRQLSPSFFSEARLRAPAGERERAFLIEVERDLRPVWP
jgi:predicted nucleotidyltransferase